MYNNRHYPIWGTEVIWLGDPILDENQNIRGIGFLAPLTENASWYGLVKAGYLAINPLSLKYPDNTMSGEDFEVPLHKLSQDEFNRAIDAGFEPDIFTMYTDALSNAADLLGLDPECGNNYWLGGASKSSVYLEDESSLECFQRIQNENPALEFLREVIAAGEYAEGVQTGFIDIVSDYVDLEEEDIEFIDGPFLNSMKQTVTAEMGKIADLWGGQLVKISERICKYGLLHMCRRGNKAPEMRGEVSILQEYLPLASRWQTMEKIQANEDEIIEISHNSVENYKSLVKSFNGPDGYFLSPALSRSGEIVLNWKKGPHQEGQVLLTENGMMKVNFVDDSDTVSDAFSENAPREIEMTVKFDAEKLSKIMSEGIDPL